MSSITSTISHGVTIGSGGYASPLTITSTGKVNNAGAGNAVSGIANALSVVNYGSITATGAGNDGIYLNGTGIGVNNSGWIVAAEQGIAMYGAGTVTNSGIVLAGHWGVVTRFASTIDNTGTIQGDSQGVELFSQGGVTNSGLIIGSDGLGGTYGAITVSNTGTIIGTYGSGIGLGQGGFVTNSTGGFISGAGGYNGIFIGGGAGRVVNAGTILANLGVDFVGNTNDTVIDTGTIIGTGGVYGETSTIAIQFDTGNDLLQFVPGSAFIEGSVDGGGGTNMLEFTSNASPGVLTGSGLTFFDFGDGTVDTGARWTLAGAVTFASSTTLYNAGTVTVDGTVSVDSLSGTGTIGFGAATGDLLAFGSLAASGNIVSNMVAGQTIEILGETITATNLLADNTLQVSLSSGGPIDIALDPGQVFTGDFFHHSNGGGNGFITENTTPCYLAGTSIRTDRGNVAVEHLRIGDCVVTLSGAFRPIKWIGTRAYSSAFAAGNRDVVPILFKVNALADGLPVRDLYVSPLHAMLLDNVLIQAEHLVNGVSVVRCPEIDPIRYFHIELQTHDVIFAEDAPAETFVDCDSRGMFHNARAFASLYPHDQAPAWKFCFPRIDSGPILDRARRAIGARAGLATEGQGALAGNLDGLGGTTISGWAFDPDHPSMPVTLEILDNDGLIARVSANRFREDLERKGVGDGRHGFELVLPRGLSQHARHEIRVRRAADRRELPGCPLTIEAVDRGMLLKAAHQSIDDTRDIDTLLWGLEAVRQRRTAGERAAVKRALIVTGHLPRRGAAILLQVDTLRREGWTIDLVASQELVPSGADVAMLKAWGVKCHRAPAVASVEEVLRRNRDGFDAVYLVGQRAADTYAAMVRVWQTVAKIVPLADAERRVLAA